MLKMRCFVETFKNCQILVAPPDPLVSDGYCLSPVSDCKVLGTLLVTLMDFHGKPLPFAYYQNVMHYSASYRGISIECDV